MPSKNNLVVLIISNGRPDNVRTLNSLEQHGYTGPIYIVLDDLDKTAPKYIENYGDMVVFFDKKKTYAESDPANNFNDLRSTTFPRNACFEIARSLGFTYFLVLDDDYTGFRYRYNDNLVYEYKATRNLDTVFSVILDFYISSGATSIAMAQGGDYMGGKEGRFGKSIRTLRKCMNSFFCSTEREFKFIGQLNEDVNTYLRLGSLGHIFLTINQVSLDQMSTQSNAGGMTDIYLDTGTYVKSFYSVMIQPSSVTINQMSGRIHHSIAWKKTVPMILREDLKKKTEML